MNSEQTVKKFFELLKQASVADQQAAFYKKKKDNENERREAYKCIGALRKALELTQLTWRNTAGKKAVERIANAALIVKPDRIKVHLFEKSCLKFIAETIKSAIPSFEIPSGLSNVNNLAQQNMFSYFENSGNFSKFTEIRNKAFNYSI